MGLGDRIKGRKDWSKPLVCHFDLNYANEDGKGINGPVITMTSKADKGQPATFSKDGASAATVVTTVQAGASSSTTPSITGVPTLGASPTTISNSTPPSTGISGGAIAGIVIGVLIGIIAALSLGFVLWRNHRKMKDIEKRMGGPTGHEETHELHGATAASPSPKYAYPAPLEMESQHSPQELYGSDVATQQQEETTTTTPVADDDHGSAKYARIK